MGPGQIHPAGKDDSVQFVVRRAMNREARRAVPVPRSHTRNTSESSGRRAVGVARWQPDSRAQGRSARASCSLAHVAARRHRSTSSLRSTANVTRYAAGRAKTTMVPMSRDTSPCVRTISRRRRLMRLRSTAVCECRGTMIPTRGSSVCDATVRISSAEPRSGLPRVRIRERSAPRVSRLARGKR